MRRCRSPPPRAWSTPCQGWLSRAAAPSLPPWQTPASTARTTRRAAAPFGRSARRSFPAGEASQPPIEEVQHRELELAVADRLHVVAPLEREAFGAGDGFDQRRQRSGQLVIA